MADRWSWASGRRADRGDQRAGAGVKYFVANAATPPARGAGRGVPLGDGRAQFQGAGSAPGAIQQGQGSVVLRLAQVQPGEVGEVGGGGLAHGGPPHRPSSAWHRNTWAGVSSLQTVPMVERTRPAGAGGPPPGGGDPAPLTAQALPGDGGSCVWPAILTAGALSLASLTLLALAAAGLARSLPPWRSRAVARAPFWGAPRRWELPCWPCWRRRWPRLPCGPALVLCGEFADFEEALYHSAVNFTTLGYGDIVCRRAGACWGRWRRSTAA